MREIKFRAWDKDDLCMRDWDNLLSHVYAKDKNTIFNDSDYEVMQFTGLKDKHGKEIYEGDIVRKDGWIYEIRWSKYGAGFDLATKNDSWPKQEDGYAYHSGLYDTEIIEVIGNVYENPDLAGGTQKEEK